MKRVFLLLAIGTLLFTSCKQPDQPEQERDPEAPSEPQPPSDNRGCITGTITIFNTGELTDAFVRLYLYKGGEVIHSDRIDSRGHFTIDNVEEGTYFFGVYKQGTIDTLFNDAIRILPKVLNNDACRRMDWAISKLPPNLYIVEVGTENRINTLDFGTYEDRLYFQIYNNSAITYTWFTDFEEVKRSREWLGTMQPLGGTLQPNSAVIITLTIDRNKLDAGLNSARFLIDSDSGGGGVLTVTATIP